MATVYLALLAILSKDRSTKLLSVVLLTALIVLTPSIMLMNPWLPDQYPYLSEAVWLTKHYFIANIHHLDETPGLGLLFSQFMLITGLGPFEVAKIYPLLVILMTPLMFLTSERICGNGALIPILLLGFTYPVPSVFHRSSLFFIFLVVLVFLLTKIVSERRPTKYALAYILAISTTVLSYSGVIVLLVALTATVPMLYLFYGRNQKIISLGTPILSLIIFLSWQVYIAEAEFRCIVGNIYYGIQEFLIFNPERFLEISAYRGTLGYTDILKVILDARIAFTVILLMLATIVAIYVLLKGRKKQVQVFASLIYLSSAIQFFLLSTFIYYGLAFAKKLDAFFVYTSTVCVVALPVLMPKFINKYKKKIKPAIVCLLVVPLLLVPLLSYHGIPYLHTPSSELKVKVFIDEYYNTEEPILATELNLPYLLFEVLQDRKPQNIRAILTPEEPIDYGSNYLILERYVTRDGYLVYSIKYEDYLKTLISSLTVNHNLVYDSERYTKLFIKA